MTICSRNPRSEGARWQSRSLSECIEKVDIPRKVPRSFFLQHGRVPIVSQEADFINGYWNDESHAVRVHSPVVIFGDHTQVLKLVDFNFVVGADGVKVLKPRSFLDASFLKYFLEAKPVASLGYARHFRHVSNLKVPIPPLEEQKRIVAVLDQAFAALDRARANAEANLVAAEGLLQRALDEAFITISSESTTFLLQDAVQGDCGLSYGIVQPGDEVQNGLPIVRPVDLTNRQVGLAGLKRINSAAARGYSRTELQGGELLLCVRGSTGTVSIAAEELAGANVTRGIVPIRFDPARVLRDFAYFQFCSASIRTQIAEKTYGAALMQINIKDLRGLRFLVPGIALQRDVVRRAEELLATTTALRRSFEVQLGDIAALRQSLLQAAFSGQLS